MKPKAKTIRLNGDMRVNLLDNLFNTLFTQRVAALVKESRDYAMRTYHSDLGSGEWTMQSTLAKRGLIPTGASITASIHKPNSQNKFETSRCGVGLQLRTVCTKRWKCPFELCSGAGEMYYLENDPGEMNNLSDDPGYAKVKKEMEGLMRARPGEIRKDLAEPIGMA